MPHAFLFPLTALAAISLSLAGCAEDSADQDHAAADGDLSELTGEFAVRLTAANPATGASASTNVFGVIKDGPEPAPITWHVRDEAEDCTLYTPEVPFCSSPCGRAACTGDDECTPYPTARPVGDVKLDGLGKSLRMTPLSGNYMPDSGLLPYPPCEEGESVRMHAEGDDYPAFSRETRCIAPLEFKLNILLEPGRDVSLTWSQPSDSELARIEVKVDISHHGGAKGKIECDTADDGELTIPSTLVDQLVELGVAGFPTIALTRRARSSSDDEPRGVSLSMLERVERPVEVRGVVSCTDDRQCGDGKTCASNLTCQP